jgi:formate dehydrogenase subunit beta
MPDLACGNWGGRTRPGHSLKVITEKGRELVENAHKNGYIEVKTPIRKSNNIREKIEGIMIKQARKFQDKYLEEDYPLPENWDEYWTQVHKNVFAAGMFVHCVTVMNVTWKKSSTALENEIIPDSPHLQGVRLSHMSFKLC